MATGIRTGDHAPAAHLSSNPQILRGLSHGRQGGTKPKLVFPPSRIQWLWWSREETTKKQFLYRLLSHYKCSSPKPDPYPLIQSINPVHKSLKLQCSRTYSTHLKSGSGDSEIIRLRKRKEGKKEKSFCISLPNIY